jgi:hypothetical protein
VRDEAETGLHVVVLEAALSSPNDLTGDYSRTRRPKAPPARNAVSAYVDLAHGYYEHQEVFRDPAADPPRQRLRQRRHRDVGVRGGAPLRSGLRDEGARLRALTL